MSIEDTGGNERRQDGPMTTMCQNLRFAEKTNEGVLWSLRIGR